LRGKIGDQINALAMATGFNLRKILRMISLWLITKWLIWISQFQQSHLTVANNIF